MSALLAHLKLGRFSIGSKVWLGFGLVLGVLLVVSLQVWLNLARVDAKVAAVQKRRPAEMLSKDLGVHLYQATSELGLYLSTQGSRHRSGFDAALEAFHRALTELKALPAVAGDPDSMAQLQTISSDFDQFESLGSELIDVAQSREKTFPGLAFANEELNPVSRSMSQLATEMVLSVEQRTDGTSDWSLFLELSDLRYDWVNVVNGVRGYLAFRGQNALADTQLYLKDTREILERLSKREDLSLDVADALARFQELYQRFGKDYARLLSIQGGEQWRTDSWMVRTRMSPLVERLAADFNQLALRQQGAIDKEHADLLRETRGTVDQVQGYLLFGLLAGGFIAWGIGRMISGPVRGVARAMSQIAHGDASTSPRLQARGNDELGQLARSFNTFADKIERAAEEERALGELLRFSLKPMPTPAYLRGALDLLIARVTWLGLQPKGAVFLAESAEDGPALRLVASRALAPELTEQCAHVAYGHCLCGQAAAQRQVVFADCVDDRHHNHFPGMTPHGHYSVPIMGEQGVVGVLVLYLPEGHPRDEREEIFLRRVTDVLSLGITTRAVHGALVEAKREAEESSAHLLGITRNLPGVIFQRRLRADGTVDYPFVSAGSAQLLGEASDGTEHQGPVPFESVHPDDRARFQEAAQRSARDRTAVELEYRLMHRDGQVRWVHCSAQPRPLHGGGTVWDGLLLDITPRKTLEMQLLQAQKLEAVGQLAAGIAHEINTPTQYVTDNAHFLEESFGELLEVLAGEGRLLEAARAGTLTPALVEELEARREAVELDYLVEEIPRAIAQSLEGVQRIGSIVGAMKEFSHPGRDQMEPVDLNAVVDNIVTVSRNEWKYVADLTIDCDPALPLVPCLRDRVGQVLLNLIVNAAQAIAEMPEVAAGGKRAITVRTRLADGEAEIRVMDNGPGVPRALRHKIFDPFFTTKEVGKGTGQGLSIAHSLVTDTHGGSLTLESPPEGGATFVIRLPLVAAASAA